MRSTSAVVAAAFVAGVSSHATIWSAWVNGVDQGDGRKVYIRSPPNNDPVKDTTSPAMACNLAGGEPVAEFVSAAAGDTIALEWYHDNRGDDIIAASHKGPVITWIAEYFEDDGAAPIWTKIAEEGYDATDKTFATDRLIAAKGMAEFKLPETLAGGKYMIRQEIIALHEADACYATAGTRGAQFYPSCIQFDITGTGSGVPSQNYDFNAEYTCDVEGIVFNVYTDITDYPIPGPAVDATLDGSSTGGSTPTVDTPPSTNSDPATPSTGGGGSKPASPTGGGGGSKPASPTGGAGGSKPASHTTGGTGSKPATPTGGSEDEDEDDDGDEDDACAPTKVPSSKGGTTNNGAKGPVPTTLVAKTKAATAPKSTGSSNSGTNAEQNTGSGACAAVWGQCGGTDFKGATCCTSGSCKELNPYYHQCIV